MSLEQELRALGTDLFPEEPDLRAAVLARLDRPPRASRSHRRPLLAFAALVLATLVAALAIPQARSALERWLGIGSARIIRVDELPPVTRGNALAGVPVTRADADRLLGVPLPLPSALPPPTTIRVPRGLGAVVVAWGDPVRIRLLVIPGGGPILQKMVPVTTGVERVDVNGHEGAWIAGTHAAYFAFGQPELAGRVLLWEAGGALTFRLDGRIDRALALRIARSIHVKSP